MLHVVIVVIEIYPVRPLLTQAWLALLKCLKVNGWLRWTRHVMRTLDNYEHIVQLLIKHTLKPEPVLFAFTTVRSFNVQWVVRDLQLASLKSASNLPCSVTKGSTVGIPQHTIINLRAINKNQCLHLFRSIEGTLSADRQKDSLWGVIVGRERIFLAPGNNRRNPVFIRWWIKWHNDVMIRRNVSAANCSTIFAFNAMSVGMLFTRLEFEWKTFSANTRNAKLIIIYLMKCKTTILFRTEKLTAFAPSQIFLVEFFF